MTTHIYQDYWEQRARRFAHVGQGLRAVGSYGMPGFYNRTIDFTQWLALRRWLRFAAGKRVLDVGCGVGRWTRRMARAGARVVGVDRSPTMLDQARKRAASDGVAERCRFVTADLAELILGVTVLQHIVDDGSLDGAVENLSRLLEPGGTAVLLEAAPTVRNDRCDSDWFSARTVDDYAGVFARAGLRIVSIHGVDPAPLKIWLLPYYRLWPRVVAVPALLALTALSLPVDALLGRTMVRASWHKLFVLTHA